MAPQLSYPSRALRTSVNQELCGLSRVDERSEQISAPRRSFPREHSVKIQPDTSPAEIGGGAELDIQAVSFVFEVVRYRGHWRTLHCARRSSPFPDQTAAILAAKKLARSKRDQGQPKLCAHSRSARTIPSASYGLGKKRPCVGSSLASTERRPDVTMIAIGGQRRRIAIASLRPSIDPGISMSVNTTRISVLDSRIAMASSAFSAAMGSNPASLAILSASSLMMGSSSTIRAIGSGATTPVPLGPK